MFCVSFRPIGIFLRMSTQLDPFASVITGLTSQSDSAVVNPDYTALVRAWNNEQHCPELLPFEHRVVESIIKTLRPQWALISARQAQWTGRESHIRDLLTMEADRVGYVLKSYLRVRLLKLEKYARFYLASSNQTLLMSEAERNFASNILKASDDTMHAMFLRHLPQGDEYFQSLTAGDDPGGDMIRKPDLKKVVFVRVLEPVGAVPIGEDAVSLEKDKMYILRYELVRDFILDKRIILI